MRRKKMYHIHVRQTRAISSTRGCSLRRFSTPPLTPRPRSPGRLAASWSKSISRRLREKSICVSSPAVAEDRLDRLPSFCLLSRVRRRTTLRGLVFLMCLRRIRRSCQVRPDGLSLTTSLDISPHPQNWIDLRERRVVRSICAASGSVETIGTFGREGKKQRT